MAENECIERRTIQTQQPDVKNIKGTTKMHTFRKTISIIATAATLSATLTTTTFASPMPIVDQTPDLDKYCQRYYGAEARLAEYSALGWQCYKSPSQTWGISGKTACMNQYGLPKAAYYDKADPYSWYCTGAAKPRIDLNRYCKTHFGSSSRAVLIGTKATDWLCQHGSWARDGISGNRACQEQHGLPKASFENRNDPYSWYCHR